MGFCTTCGEPLGRDGSCPRGHLVSRPRRRAAWPALLAVGTSLVMAIAVTVVGAIALSRIGDVRGDLEGLAGEIRALSAQVSSQDRAIARLSARIETLERGVSDSLTPTEISNRARASVFSVESGEIGEEILGTAFVLRSEGRTSLLMTNYHVVENAWLAGGTTVDVTHGDRTYPATIEAVSPEEDLAVLRVDLRLDAIPAGRERPSVGDAVVVIGSPLGLERTVATGVVSAYREGYLQFSAPVSPGDSGAPVLNDQGEVVGVVVAKVVEEAAEGLSFAIPIQRACRSVIGC